MDRAKAILRKNFEQGKASEIKDLREEILMRTVFSFHPNLERAAMKHREHKIKVGSCLGHQSYFVVSS